MCGIIYDPTECEENHSVVSLLWNLLSYINKYLPPVLNLINKDYETMAMKQVLDQ